ncbi:hybrid sensor histidine kinase/response regulator transcription factor [Polaribacter sp.]|uniref:hybrid sensor histidine kinase/response regulator transcription factor n=1 Tax=Polaribacter sp. TaxID=1920175 RepID=UPI003F6D70FE
MRFTFKLFILLTVISTISVQSQNKTFHQITSKDGLSQSEVYSFLKDSKGFMWFGTIDGLNRFDGYSIKIFNTEKDNLNSLTNNTIRTLLEDNQGRIWIGTDDGLNMYSYISEKVYQIIPVSLSNQKLIIHSLLQYGNYLYLGTGKGLYRIKLDDFTEQKNEKVVLEEIFIENENEKNTAVLNLKSSRFGGFWLQTNKTIRRVIAEPLNKNALTLETPVLNENYNFFDLIEDNANYLWITTTKKGLIRYDLKKKQERIFNKSKSKDGPSSLKCSSIAIDMDGNIWFGTLDNGLNLIKETEKNKENILFQHIKYNLYNPKSINSNLVRNLYVSDDNILWLGTIGAGINYYNSEQKKFKHYRLQSATGNGSNFIRSIIQKDDNVLWAGTHNNGFYEIDKFTKAIEKKGLGNTSVFYIKKYKQNYFFICTGEGLYLVKDIDNKVVVLDQFSTNATFYIIEGLKDYYWLASFNGLYRLKVENNLISVDKHYLLKPNLKAAPANCRVLYYKNEDSTLLVGTEGGGLHVLTLDEKHEVIMDKKYKNNGEKGSISNNYIRSIIKDSFNTFWIGTYEGLNRMEKNKISNNYDFIAYTKKDGLPSNMINSIVEDNNKHLWIGTNNGLSKFSLTEAVFFNYYESDGIQGNEFSEHTVFSNKNGEIFMGGINGITSFFPNKIQKSKKLPKTTITDFFIDDIRIQPNQKISEIIPLTKGIAISDSITLLPNQNNIGFNFSSMLYPVVKKITYAYKLEGFDKNWQYTKSDTKFVKYTNLDFGKYTFKVKASNEDGIWENKGRSIFIHIQTPFKYSWYAYILYALIIFAALIFYSYYSVIRYNTKNKLQLEKEHNKKVKSLNKLRTQFFINISHDLRTPLTLIKAPLDSIIKENNLTIGTKEKLLLVKRNVNRLNYLIEQLLDVRRAEKSKLDVQIEMKDIIDFTRKEISHFNYAISKKGLEYTINCPKEKLIVGFDVRMLSKVYFNLFSNAIKYTEKGKIDVLIEKVNQKDYQILNNSNFDMFVKVEVTDTGKGISPNQLKKVFKRFYQEDTTYGKGYGIGLSHTFQLIEAHFGYIEAESKQNQGTTIRFFIPYSNKFKKETEEIIIGEDDIYREDFTDKVTQETEAIRTSLKTLLIVEDNTDMRIFLKSELKENYNILEAGDGIKGIEIAENNDVDLIISDVMMPNMDGISFCNHIKSKIKTSHIPIILLTAKTDKKSKYEGISIGADDYIPKPFEIEYLALRIRKLLESRELLRKIFQKRNLSLKPSSVTVNSLDEKFIKDLLEALEEAIPESEFSVTSLEDKLGMSHSNFYRKVKSLTGKSGKELLDEMRMKRAKQILIDNKKIRIDEVAYMVGFSNPKYFGKSFKETFGVSPTEMKKRNNSSEDLS